MIHFRKLVSFVVLLALTACNTSYRAVRMTKTELYFGLSKPDGSVISPQAWQAFADTVIATTFIEGSTIIDGQGQWLGKNSQLISEPSKILIILSKLTPKRSTQIEIVREKYKKYYEQEAVMRIDETMKVAF
ncbi:DUF3574 domain-containing protein [Runella sp. MFBS21]|uniref:DUF3574 domain-containing protein n=1 Tax=Runella sp. MFBS21 TaxID=3034018 RepID=UPI0023F93AC1|nr:DUF3574 domain-containing protein [Runella sp. MFBS21]MDF7817122.1 DUF3574 domain-containing protein [Runella sp. MFBS21]